MSSDRSMAYGPPAHNRPTLSIRVRLVLLLLVAVVPLMLERVRLLEATRTERLENVAADVIGLAKQGVEGQREVISSVQAVLKVLAGAYIAIRNRGESCNFYLRDFVANMPAIKGVSIADADGRVICSSVDQPTTFDLSDRSYFREAMRSRDFAVSNRLYGRFDNDPTMIAAYPTHAIDHLLESVILAAVDLPWLSRVAASMRGREGATVMLVDRAGMVLAHYPMTPTANGHTFAQHPLVREALSRAEGTVTTHGLDGIRRVYAFIRVPWTDASLVVGLPESEALQRIDREIRLAYLQLIALGLLVVLAAWYGGERLIVRPINALANTATRFGRGELEVRLTPTNWAKEFRPLATALNEMARQLAEREEELRTSNHHLAELASVDALSGLANRRGFDARLDAEWRRAIDLQRPLALLMIDVDHFKAFNDHYGHVAGDSCLRRVGHALGAMADANGDFAARYGGEEFVLLMPGADLDRASEIAERLRRAVEELAIPHAASPSGRVTLSIGVAALRPSACQPPAQLLEAADAGLYAAKRRGRDAVVAHGAVELQEAS